MYSIRYKPHFLSNASNTCSRWAAHTRHPLHHDTKLCCCSSSCTELGGSVSLQDLCPSDSVVVAGGVPEHIREEISPTVGATDWFLGLQVSSSSVDSRASFGLSKTGLMRETSQDGWVVVRSMLERFKELARTGLLRSISCVGVEDFPSTLKGSPRVNVWGAGVLCCDTSDGESTLGELGRDSRLLMEAFVSENSTTIPLGKRIVPAEVSMDRAETERFWSK